MTDRGKLIELLGDGLGDYYDYCDDLRESGVGVCECREEYLADHLLANGVTVQNWIPVTERLPEDGCDVWAYQNRGTESRFVPAVYASGVWFDCCFNCEADHITHWMPLPEAPKEDA